MKQKKASKEVSDYYFFSRKKIVKPKFDSAYSDKIQIAVSGTNDAVTTADNRALHRKSLCKANSELAQEPNNRGTGLREPEGRFIKSPGHSPFTTRTANPKTRKRSPQS